MVALCAEPVRQFQCKLLVELRLDCPLVSFSEKSPFRSGLRPFVMVANASNHGDSSLNVATRRSLGFDPRSTLSLRPRGLSIVVELSPFEEVATARLVR